MKNSILLAALFSSLSVFAAEVKEIGCSYDHRPYDGDAATVSLKAASEGKYDFSMLQIPSGRTPGKTYSASIAAMECVFGERFPGVFSCFKRDDRYEETSAASASYGVLPYEGDVLAITVKPATKTRKIRFKLSDCTVSSK